MSGEDWGDADARAFGMLIDVPGRDGEAARDVVLLVLNASHEPAEFAIPAPPNGSGWKTLLDTGSDDEAGDGALHDPGPFTLPERCMIVFEAVAP
jgi:glycogen operon protein